MRFDGSLGVSGRLDPCVQLTGFPFKIPFYAKPEGVLL